MAVVRWLSLSYFWFLGMGIYEGGTSDFNIFGYDNAFGSLGGIFTSGVHTHTVASWNCSAWVG